ncbi:MAG: hypothetical protein IJZ82_01930 [Lachnospiraceae bacterium]|nr:hypothetical protein [Lachnospiraceae bacterium]
MKKKVLAALLSATMVMSMMTACGGSEEPAASSNEPTKTEAPAADPTEAPAADPTEAPAEPTEEPVAEPTLAEPEDLPDPLYHFAMDGTDEGIVTIVRDENNPGANTGATHGIIESSTYVKDGVENPVVVQYANGPVGTCTYIDGNFGLSFPVEGFDSDAYTLSFWLNADRLSTYGPTLQIGANMGMADDAGVKWLNFTQSEWGANSAKIFPVVWNRNSETGVWPWVYAGDDSIHGKKEWVLVTLVSTGTRYTYAEDGLDRIACQLYLDGVLAFDAVEGTYGGLAPDVLKPHDNFECYWGLNYWDSLFKGFVDEFYIFDEALTAGQVASLYLEGDPTVESVAEAPEEVVVAPLAVTPTGTAVGATDGSTGFWGAHSETWAVAEGETVSKTFVNWHRTEEPANWNNFVVVLQNVANAHGADADPAYAEYAVVRADNYGWKGAENTGANLDTLGWVLESNWNWDNFVAELQGATVTVSVTNNGGTADVVCDVVAASGATYQQSYKNIAVDGDLHFCFTVDGCCLDIQ